MNSSLSRRAPRTVDASSNEARHGSTGGDGDSIQSSIELMPLSPPKFDRKLDVIEEYMKSTTYGDRIYEASRRDDLGTASIMGSSEAVEAIRRFNVVYFRSVSAQPTLADEAPMEEGAMEAAVPSRTSSTRSREGATINYTDGQGEMIQAVAATETLPSVSDEPPSSLFSGLQTASSITTWTSSGIEAATRSLVRLLLADKEVGSALRKGLSNSKSEAGLDSFVRTIGPPLASYAKDLQAIAQTPDQERVVEFVQIIADDASNFVHRMLDTASLSSSSSGDAAQGLSSTSASVTTPDNPIILGKLEDATSVSTDSLSKSKEANDPSVEADLSSHAREFLLSAQPLASLRATLQDLILTVPKLDPPGETDTMPTEVPLEKESAQENFAHGVEEDSGPDGKLFYGSEPK